MRDIIFKKINPLSISKLAPKLPATFIDSISAYTLFTHSYLNSQTKILQNRRYLGTWELAFYIELAHTPTTKSWCTFVLYTPSQSYSFMQALQSARFEECCVSLWLPMCALTNTPTAKVMMPVCIVHPFFYTPLVCSTEPTHPRHYDFLYVRSSQHPKTQ